VKLHHNRSRIAGFSLLLIAMVETGMALYGPYAVPVFDLRSLPLFLLIFATLLLGARLGLGAPPYGTAGVGRLSFTTELVLALGLLLFLFNYIFAANANMDYVQRFMESGGNLQLAVDTTTERRIVAVRYLPLVTVLLLLHLSFAVRRRRYELLLTLLSVGLTALSFPSGVSLSGIGVLGWVALTPLIYVLWRGGYRRILFYGITYGVLATLLSNYWLGTFSLVSLMAVVLIYFGFYTVFMVPFGGAVLLFRRSSPAARVFLTAAAWTVFELFRSTGFLGYPWVLVGHSQYANLPLIQISEFTGVWGVSFVVVLVSAGLAELLGVFDRRNGVWSTPTGGAKSYSWVVLSAPIRHILIAVAAVVAATHLYGWSVLLLENRYPEADETPRVALIQQNSDPRKHEYERTFQTLRELTDRALKENPDIVIWSETAFVPNIRRWGREDPERYRLARLVREFRDYQGSIGTWLLTGNDDYQIVLDEDGREVERLSYNAAVLFSDEGERLATYHKMKLVPFTEYFPYEEELPFVYKALEEFDVSFWEPGDERTVFAHPLFTFSTPICFEDVFPDEVRRFVLNGAEVILNITNDYWSLTEVQAQQHFVASLFRSVENRRPLLRASASGVTAYVDPYGRVVARRPQYSEEYLITDVPVSRQGNLTPYTRYGDWFPRLAGVALLLLVAVRIIILRRSRR